MIALQDVDTQQCYLTVSADKGRWFTMLFRPRPLIIHCCFTFLKLLSDQGKVLLTLMIGHQVKVTVVIKFLIEVTVYKHK